MGRSRVVLLTASATIVVVLLAGGLGLRVGAAETSYGKVILFSEVLSLVLDNYVDPVAADELITGAYESMLSGLDAHGAYLTPDEVAQWKATPDIASAGPGLAVLKAYGALQVVAVEEGSTADTAGIEAGDQIRTIDGVSLRDLSLEQGLKLLNGPEGTMVTLGLLHPRGEVLRESIDVERRSPSAPAHEIEVVKGAAVLTVRDLARLDEDKLRSDLDGARGEGASALLVDLRNLVEPDNRFGAALVALLRDRTPLQLKDKDGKVIESLQRDGAGRELWTGSLGLLTNGATAGAAEAAVALLRDQGVRVYGEETFGLGAEPKLFELPDGSGLLVSAHIWETDAGTRWNGEGLSPDEEISVEGRAFEAAFEEQRNRAVDQFVTDVADASKDRQEAA